MSALITVNFVVPAGYSDGDYARLFANAGSGDIDWDTPVDNHVNDLFPNRGGIFGFGHTAFGQARYGRSKSERINGFGNVPFGKSPFGSGTAFIVATHRVTTCGAYKFAFGAYDSLDNPGAGSPEEVTVNVHIPPPPPTGLTKNSYNKETDILVLNAA